MQFSSHSDKRTWMTLSFGWDETKQAVGRTQILSDKIRDVDEILPENPEAQLGRSVAFVCWHDCIMTHDDTKIQIR